jgi:hypothetical protein
MRNSGTSLDRLVNRRQVSDIVEAFGVTSAVVSQGLRNTATLDYLAGVGFDMRGKSANELNARETFELLSARQIKGTDQIVDILSSLQDKLAKDRAKQARRRARQKKASETATIERKYEMPLQWTHKTTDTIRNPVLEKRSASETELHRMTEHLDHWPVT